MITAAVLIGLIVLGIFILNKLFDVDETFGLEIVAMFMVIVSVIGLVFHIFFIIQMPYEYNNFKARIDSFEITLKESRSNMTEFEKAAILKDITEINMDIASKQYYNTTFFGQYVDDRFDLLEPIK